MEIFGANIVVLLIAVAIGYGIGLLDSRFTAALKNARAKPKVEIKEVVRTVEVESPSILLVNFDANQNPVVKVDGAPVDVATITPEQRKRLVNIIVQIRPWLDPNAAAQRPAATPIAAPQPAPPAAPIPAPAAAETPPAQTQSQPASPFAQPASWPGAHNKEQPSKPHHQPQPVAYTPPPQPHPTPYQAATSSPTPQEFRGDIIKSAQDYLSNRFIRKKTGPLIRMVAQIDQVLQARLVGHPYSALGLSLSEHPSGSVIVNIGDKQYVGIDTVPDLAIQQFIRDAVAAWEKGVR